MGLALHTRARIHHKIQLHQKCRRLQPAVMCIHLLPTATTTHWLSSSRTYRLLRQIKQVDERFFLLRRRLQPKTKVQMKGQALRRVMVSKGAALQFIHKTFLHSSNDVLMTRGLCCAARRPFRWWKRGLGYDTTMISLDSHRRGEP